MAPKLAFGVLFTIVVSIERYAYCFPENIEQSSDMESSSNSLQLSMSTDPTLEFSENKNMSKEKISCSNTNGTDQYSFCAGKLCIPADYNRLSLPKSQVNASALSIKMEFDIIDVLEVNDKDFSITLSMYLVLEWEDSRLIGQRLCSKEPCHVPVDTDMLSRIWLPDIYIYSLKTIKVLNVLNRFEGKNWNNFINFSIKLIKECNT